VQYFLEAKDPATEATVLLVCSTSREAWERARNWQQEGLDHVTVTDRFGNRLSEDDQV
jgi:hypothetical protein